MIPIIIAKRYRIMKLVETKFNTSGTEFLREFDVADAGSIYKTVATKNPAGQITCEIFFEVNRSESLEWLGAQRFSKKKLKDVIKQSKVYQAEHTDPNAFYQYFADKFCKCNCDNPFRSNSIKSKVLAVDLDNPEYGRQESRDIIFLTKCGNCGEDITHGTGFGSYNSYGLENLKGFAKQATSIPFKFERIFTSIHQQNITDLAKTTDTSFMLI